MSKVERRRRGAAVFLAATAAAAVAALATSLWLTWDYRPPAVSPWTSGPAGGGTRRATEINEAILGLLSGLALALAIAGVLPRARRAFALSWRSAVGGSAVLLATLAAGATRPLLEWDALALWQVTVGSDLSGYWTAAFDDRIRFVLVDRTEVEPSTYAWVLGGHLAALLVVLAGLVLVATDLRRGRGGQNNRSSVDSMPRSSS